MRERILVTGGAGYLGSVLVPALLAEGWSVTVIDNFRYGQSSLTDACHDPRLEIVRGDAREASVLRRFVPQADALIPLAAIVGAPACDADPTAARSTNLEAIRTLLALRSPRQRIFFPATNSGYGIGEADKPCTEESPLRPVSLYGVTKVEAEKAVLDAGNSVTFRFATLFGVSPRMRMDLLVNDFVYRALTDRSLVVFEGHFRRNFLHVRDAARAFLHGLGAQLPAGPYNVGLSDANLSKLQLCAKIKESLPKFVYTEAPVGEDVDKRDYIVSNEKIERTGFRPKYSLEAGIRELIKGYQIVRPEGHANHR